MSRMSLYPTTAIAPSAVTNGADFGISISRRSFVCAGAACAISRAPRHSAILSGARNVLFLPTNSSRAFYGRSNAAEPAGSVNTGVDYLRSHGQGFGRDLACGHERTQSGLDRHRATRFRRASAGVAGRARSEPACIVGRDGSLGAAPELH